MASALHFTLATGTVAPSVRCSGPDPGLTRSGILGADGGPMQVNITNALWAEKTYTFEADFLDTLAENYGAG